MWRITVRHVRTSLRARPLQTALVALLMAASAATLALALNVRHGADKPYDQVFAATRGADVNLVTQRAGVDLSRLRSLDGIERTSGPVPELFTHIARGADRPSLALLGLRDVEPAVDRPHVTDGRWLIGAGDRGVVLERSLARALGVGPGDRLALESGTRVPVVGVAVTASVGPFEDWDPARAWTGERALRTYAGRTRLDQVLALRLRDGVDSDAFAQRAMRLYPPAAVVAWGSGDVRQSVTDRTNTDVIVLASSTLFILFAVGFIVANVVAGRVIAQRREVGMLKAVGCTPRQVTTLLVAEYVTLALAGGAVGTAIGLAVSPALLRHSADLLGTPVPGALDAGVIAASLLVPAAAVAVFAAVPAWRAGRLSAVAAITDTGARAARTPSRLGRAARAARLPTPVVLGVKDAFSGRGRTALTIASLAITVATLVIALSVEATYHRVIADPSLRAKPYDVRIDPGKRKDLDALLTPHANEIAARFTIASIPARARGREVQLRVLGGDYQPYAVPDGRMLRGPGEAIVGRGVLDTFGVHVGDRLRLDVAGRPMTVRIVGRHVEPDNDGQVAIVDRRSVPAAAFDQLAPDTALKLVPGADPHALQRALRGAVAVEVTSDEVEAERADLRPVVYSMDAVLLIIGLVNLLTTLLLAVRDRVREFGTYKVLGLTPRQVLVTVTAGGSVHAALAVVLGIPLGLIAFRVLLSTQSPSDGPDIATNPTWWWLVLLVPGAIALTALASALPARVAAAVQPARAVRYE